MRRGWLARPGDEFVSATRRARHLRLTVHDLSDAELARLAPTWPTPIRAATTTKAG
jgi:hypothetical protein